MGAYGSIRLHVGLLDLQHMVVYNCSEQRARTMGGRVGLHTGLPGDTVEGTTSSHMGSHTDPPGSTMQRAVHNHHSL